MIKIFRYFRLFNSILISKKTLEMISLWNLLPNYSLMNMRFYTMISYCIGNSCKIDLTEQTYYGIIFSNISHFISFQNNGGLPRTKRVQIVSPSSGLGEQPPHPKYRPATNWRCSSITLCFSKRLHRLCETFGGSCAGDKVRLLFIPTISDKNQDACLGKLTMSF